MTMRPTKPQQPLMDNYKQIHTSTIQQTTKEISRPSAPWIDDDIREGMSARNKAQMLVKRDRSNITLQNHYKILKKQVKNLVAHHKKEYR